MWIPSWIVGTLMDRKRSPGKPPPEHQCQGTSKRSGERCGKWKMRGKNHCHIHGGKSVMGVALPQFDHGRFSASVPSRLNVSYHEALNDPKRLELEDELALVIGRNRELLESLYSGESSGLWRRLKQHKRAMDAARRNADSARHRGDTEAADRYDDKQAEHFNTLLALIEAGAADTDRWDEIMRNIDAQRRLAESERKRRVEDHQVVTTEEILAIMGAVLAIIMRHVKDERIRRTIGDDIEGLAERTR